ncbi:MAG TPA: cobalamin B12-binding domain-containing protein, partial [Kiritimatiellia bacterium]|nr:cobalamin B12-binding domain-containing protein [Kiritimatiellia bacterium]
MTSAAADILLVAVNARYSHCAYAARSLLANLGGLAASARILETDLDITPLQLAAQIVESRPRVVGFSVYLWSVRLIEATARILRTVAPHLRLAAGGPELTADYANAALFDTVITGEGETAFRAFCERTL